MGRKLYVGNLSYDADNHTMEQWFSPHGSVESAQVVMDRDTGRSKGFGFVEMSTEAEAQTAMAELDGKEFGGRNIKVNEAKPRENKFGGGGGRY